MKRLIAALILTASAVQAGERLTLEVDNQSDHAIVGLSVWEVLPDGSSVDDNLGAIVEPVPGHALAVVNLAIVRCFEHLRVVVAYDDGHEAEQDMNYCESPKIAFTY